jgi:gliding motility-associated-like protein
LSLTSITPSPAPIFPQIGGAGCPYSGTCSGGSTNQTQIHTYEGILNLPSERSDWTIQAAILARNPGITTVTTPLPANDYDICVEAVINNTSSVGCNNSPIWNYNPPSYLCVNSNNTYSTSATDADGDSIVYSMINPMNNWTGVGFSTVVNNVPYNIGYSFTSPLSGVTNFNPYTGNMLFSPTLQQTTIWAVKAEEYRNGVLIGSITRDIQTTSLICNTDPPNLTGIDTLALADINTNSFYFCANGTAVMTFDINALTSPPGGTNNITMSASGLPTNAIFTIINNGTNNPIGTFTWVPQYVDLLIAPFFFTVDLIDDACISNTASFTYQIDLTSSSGFTFMESITNVSCSSLLDGAIDISVNGPVGTPTFSWTGPNGFVAATEDIFSLETGQYDVIVVDQDGCSSTASYQVGTNSVSLSETDIMPFCNGSSDGEIDLTVNGGILPLTFLWEKLIGPGAWQTISNNEDLTNLSAGTYRVTVTDSLFCSNNLSVTLTEPSPMVTNGSVTSNYNGSDISCNGYSDGIISALVSGGTGSYTYSIDQFNYTTTQIFSALNANNYTISYKDGNGCLASETITLNNPSPININLISKEDISCFGSADGSIDITATGGTQNLALPLYNYSWINTAIGLSSNTEDLLNINQPGTYSLNLTDANACPSSVFIVNISEPTEITAIHSELDISCFGVADGSISLLGNGGNPPYTISWLGPNAYSSIQNANPSNITQLNSGDYDYNIIDSKGCSLQSASSIYISEPTQINISLYPSLVTCYSGADGSIDLTTNIPLPLFEWTSSSDLNYFETSEDIYGLEQGVYTVKVTDLISGCFEFESASISTITPYNIAITSSNENCYNANDGEIEITPNSATTYYFLWNYPDGSTSIDEDIYSLYPGLYQLIISYTSTNSNSTSITCNVPYSPFTILPADEIIVNPSITLVSCEGGNNGGIGLNVNGGSGSFNYLWSNTEITKDINNLNTGTYSVTILDDNNCIWDSTFNLSSIAFDTLSVLKSNISCKGEATGSIDINGIIGGTYPYSFSWTGPNSFSSNNEDLSNLYSGAYQVNISDATGCQISRYITLSEPNDFLYSIPTTISHATCNGSSDGYVELNITGGTAPYQSDWGSANPDSLVAGNYNYIIYDSNNCIMTDNVTINEPTLFTITPFVTKIKCPNENTGSISILINNLIGSPTVEWTGPNDIITNQIFSATGLSIDSLYTGNYNCIVIDDNNCTVQQTIYVPEPYTRAGSPLFLTSNNTSYEVSCKGGSDAWIKVSMAGGDYSLNTYQYLWGNGETNDSIFSLSADTISLTVIDSINCSQDFSYLIREPDSLVSFTYLSSDYNNYNISCYNDSDGFVKLFPIGGVHNYSYTCYVNDILNPNLNSNILSNLKSDNLFIIIKDNNGCQYSDTISLIQPDLLQFVLNLKPDTCSLNKGYADLQVNGGTPNYTYSWSNGSIDSFSDNISEGRYEVIVVDENKCKKSASFDIYNLASPIANFSLNPSHKKFNIQLEEPFVFVDISETFTQKIKKWTWYFSDNSLGNDSIVQHSFSEIGEHQVLLEIETEYNCFDTISKSVVIDNYTLWIPDTFTPNDDAVNDSFMPKGVGIKEYKIQIFSRWGEVIFFSEDINTGWDGISKNNNKSMTGSYTYYIEVVNVFNEFYKYEGIIKLIR